MVWLGAVLGLRWSEVAGLRVGRLDLDAGRLSVAEALVRGTGGRNVFGPPKSKAGRRTMFMPSVIVAMLSATPRAGRVRREPTPMRSCSPTRRVARCATPTGAAGSGSPPSPQPAVPDAGFHDLRRLNATTLVVEGIDVKTAQTRLGHADPRMTLAIYASAPASVDRAAADVIGERFFGEQRQQAETRGPKMFRAISAPIVPEGFEGAHRRLRPEQGLSSRAARI